jgi:hypothetical protein
MPKPPDRALRIILGIFSLLVAAGGLLFIFSGKPLVMRLFLSPPESEVSTLYTLHDEGNGRILSDAQPYAFFRLPRSSPQRGHR